MLVRWLSERMLEAILNFATMSRRLIKKRYRTEGEPIHAKHMN